MIHLDMNFYVGLDDVCNARHFPRCFISVNRLRKRKGDFHPHEWIMDSGAFTEISTHGGYRHGVQEYADQINRWKRCGNLLAAVAQDYMCEAWMLEKTGLTVADHQRLTIERYDALRPLTDVYVLPVLQGYDPQDYVTHLQMYGDRLKQGQWVGVGSVCKRNADPGAIYDVLSAIKRERPDLRLHGFGIKTSSLADGGVHGLLETSDSMAWSFAARKQGRDAHDWREAERFVNKINAVQTRQSRLQFA